MDERARAKPRVDRDDAAPGSGSRWMNVDRASRLRRVQATPTTRAGGPCQFRMEQTEQDERKGNSVRRKEAWGPVGPRQPRAPPTASRSFPRGREREGEWREERAEERACRGPIRNRYLLTGDKVSLSFVPTLLLTINRPSLRRTSSSSSSSSPVSLYTVL